jgi:hypothetical protein
MEKYVHHQHTNGMVVAVEGSGNVVLDLYPLAYITITNVEHLIDALRTAQIMRNIPSRPRREFLMKIQVEINVVVEVTATLDTETGELSPTSAEVSCYDGDNEFCLYSEDLLEQEANEYDPDYIKNDCGWLSDDDVRDRFGERVLMDADQFVGRKLYTAGA